MKTGKGEDAAKTFDQLFTKRSSPYYLFNTDQLGACVVSKVLVGQTNFYAWRKAMQVPLDSRKKFGFVDGTLKRPSIKSEEQEVWDIYINNLVLIQTKKD